MASLSLLLAKDVKPFRSLLVEFILNIALGHLTQVHGPTDVYIVKSVILEIFLSFFINLLSFV